MMIETLASLFDHASLTDPEVTMEDRGDGIIAMMEKRGEDGTITEIGLLAEQLVRAARKVLEWYPQANESLTAA